MTVSPLLRLLSTSDIVSQVSAPLRECVRNDADVVLEEFHTRIVSKVRVPVVLSDRMRRQ